MGCCSSTYANDGGDKCNTTYDGYYSAAAQQRHGSKRSYSSRISNGSSSGVSSACTSPSRRSMLSGCTTPPSSPTQQTNAATVNHKPKTCNFTLSRKHATNNKALEMLSICDDFNDAQLQQLPMDINGSFGYYSESGNSSSVISTPSNSCLKRTQDTSMTTRPDSPMPAMPLTPTPSDLQMEMYMMSHANGLMPKTSSPLSSRRDVTFDMVAAQSAPSQSYKKWANYLQSTPAYMLHNITDIPEAIAGHFSPLEFPAYTDLEEMDSAAKRFKADVHHAVSQSDDDSEMLHDGTHVVYRHHKPSNLTHTITTDL